MTVEFFRLNRQTLEAYFKAAWSLSDGTVLYEGDDQSPPTSGNWLRFTIIPSGSEQISLGADAVEREVGVVAIQIFTPAEQGRQLNDHIADLALNILRRKSINIETGGRVQLYSGTLKNMGSEYPGYLSGILYIQYKRDLYIA